MDWIVELAISCPIYCEAKKDRTQVTRQNAHSDYSLWVLEDTAVRRRSSGAIEPSQQPVDPGVGHLGDEVLVDEDVARLEVPVDQRRRQAVQVIQSCS